MTQKELAYVEDAIGHESIIIDVLNDSIESLENEDLVEFMNEKLNDHISLKENLMNLLEEESNE